MHYRHICSSSSTGADLPCLIYTNSDLIYDNVNSSKQDLRKLRYKTALYTVVDQKLSPKKPFFGQFAMWQKIFNIACQVLKHVPAMKRKMQDQMKAKVHCFPAMSCKYQKNLGFWLFYLEVINLGRSIGGFACKCMRQLSCAANQCRFNDICEKTKQNKKYFLPFNMILVLSNHSGFNC